MVHLLHQHAALGDGGVEALLLGGAQIRDLGGHQQDLPLRRIIAGAGRHHAHVPHPGGRSVNTSALHFTTHARGELARQVQIGAQFGRLLRWQGADPLRGRPPQQGVHRSAKELLSQVVQLQKPARRPLEQGHGHGGRLQHTLKRGLGPGAEQCGLVVLRLRCEAQKDRRRSHGVLRRNGAPYAQGARSAVSARPLTVRAQHRPLRPTGQHPIVQVGQRPLRLGRAVTQGRTDQGLGDRPQQQARGIVGVHDHAVPDPEQTHSRG